MLNREKTGHDLKLTEGVQPKPYKPEMSVWDKKDLKISLAQSFNLASADLLKSGLPYSHPDFKKELKARTKAYFGILQELIGEELV